MSLRALAGDLVHTGPAGSATGLALGTAFPGRAVRAPLRIKSTFAEAVTVTGFVSTDPSVRLEIAETRQGQADIARHVI